MSAATGVTRDVLIKRVEVEAATGLSRATLHRRVRDGSFPKPISVGGRSIRWLVSEIDSWMEQAKEARG